MIFVNHYAMQPPIPKMIFKFVQHFQKSSCLFACSFKEIILSILLPFPSVILC